MGSEHTEELAWKDAWPEVFQWSIYEEVKPYTRIVKAIPTE
jgi:hypothetical protein